MNSVRRTDTPHRAGDPGDATRSDPSENDFDAFFRQHYQAVRSYLRLAGRETQYQDDLAQEVFLMAFRHWEKLRAHAEPRGWLLTVAKRLVIDRWRRDTHLVFVDPTTLPDTEAPASDVLVENKLDARNLIASVATLMSERQWQIFSMRFVLGLSTKEISTILGISANTVHVHLSRARRIVSDFLGDNREHALLSDSSTRHTHRPERVSG